MVFGRSSSIALVYGGEEAVLAVLQCVVGGFKGVGIVTLWEAGGCRGLENERGVMG